jgi:hypothetical protein
MTPVFPSLGKEMREIFQSLEKRPRQISNPWNTPPEAMT